MTTPSASSVSPVTIKQVPSIRVVSLRTEIDSFHEQGRLWKILGEFMAQQDTLKKGPGFAIHHNLGAVVGQEGKIDVEVCIPVTEDFTMPPNHEIPDLDIRVLEPLDRVASVILSGACTGLPDAYTSVFAWMKQHDEKQHGASREIYLTYDTDPMSQDYRCEVQIPLE